MADKVYYDESCYVCSLEINAVRKRGEACGIEFIDIIQLLELITWLVLISVFFFKIFTNSWFL